MSNYMTRKSMAVGAVLSLALTGLVGVAPAQAVTALTLSPSAGSQTSDQYSVLGAEFVMKSTATSATATSEVRYLVKGITAAQISTVVGRFVTDLDDILVPYTALTTVDVSTASQNQVSISPIAAADALVLGDKWAVGKYFQMKLKVNSTLVTATSTVSIQGFEESEIIGNDLPDPLEVKSPITNLTLYKGTEVIATTTIESVVPTAALTTLEATVVLDKGINMASTIGGVTVAFKENAAVLDATAAVVWDADAGVYVSNSAAVGVISSTAVYSAQAKVLGATVGGNTASTSFATGAATALTPLAANAGTSVVNLAGFKLRAGTGAFSVFTDVTAGTATPAGRTVTFNITKTSLRTAASLSAGGKTLSSTGTSITVDVVTDADGFATLPIAYTGFATTTTADAFTIRAYSAGTAGIVYSDVAAVPFVTADSVATALVDLGSVGGDGNTAQADIAARTMPAGGTVTITYQVVDQFGQVPAGTHRVRVRALAPGGAVNANPVFGANGQATFTLTDNSGTSTATYNVVAYAVQKAETDGTYNNATQVLGDADALDATIAAYVASGSADGTTLPVLSRIVIAPAASAATVTVDDVNFVNTTDKLRVAKTAIATADTRVVRSSIGVLSNLEWAYDVPADIITAGDAQLAGTVRTTTGALMGGTSVTLSSPNILFIKNGVYSIGSITFQTDETGAWAGVNFASNKSGQQTVTVTSGTAATTLVVEFAAATADAANTIVISAPEAAPSGSTFTVTVTLTDRYGNPVAVTANSDITLPDFRVTYAAGSGSAGIVVAGLPDSTNSSGQATFNVLVGANDVGTGVITASYDKNGDEDYADSLLGDFTVQKTVLIGTTVPVVPVAGNFASWTKRLTNNEVKFYAKNVVNEGKVQLYVNGREIAWVRAVDGTDPKLRLANGFYYLVRTVGLSAGKNVFKIRVNGTFVDFENGRDWVTYSR